MISQIQYLLGITAKGQATMANSLPVTFASDQSGLTVAGGKTNNNAAPGATNVGALVAVANAAAPSWTEGNLVALSTDLTGALRITGSISATNPSVAATAGAVPASATYLGVNVGGNLVGVTGTGTSINANVTNSVAVTGTFWQATQPVSIASSVAVTGTFWQATQPVSGTVTATVASDGATAGAVPASATYLGVNVGGNLVGVTGTGTSINANVTNSVAVTGTFWQATQPVSIASAVPVTDNSGSLTVDSAQLPASLGQQNMTASLPVVIASNQTGVPVSDNGGSLTVDSAQLPVALGQTTMANSLSVAIASNQGVLQVGDNSTTLSVDDGAGSLTVDGTVTANIGAPTTGGYSVYRLLAAATTNANTIKASAGQVFGWYLYNTSASAKFVKFYNQANTTNVPNSATVFMTIPLPATSGSNISFPAGIAFSTGITIAITGAVADNDNTSVTANDVVMNIFYA